MIAAGVLISFLGLCVMPAALSEHSEGNLLGIGACLLAFGFLAIAAGIYVKARMLQATAAAAPGHDAAATKRNRGNCDLCRQESPVIHCKVHQFHLCANCLAEHYDFRACVYVPSTRRTENKPAKAMAARARG